MKRVVLFGIGSSLVVEYAETCRRLGYAVAAAIQNRPGAGWAGDAATIVGVRDVEPALRALPCFCPMFTPHNRYVASVEAAALGFIFPAALIDPTAVVASSVHIGGGSFLNAGVIVGADTAIAEHVVVNRGASIGHHAVLGAFASVGPSAVIGGHATIGRGATVGMGAVVLPKVTVGPYAVVGAGAVVTSDVPARTKVFGNPARAVATGLADFDALDDARSPL